MLFGQNFRGRHQRGLIAAVDGAQGREGRHDRLAAAHVALHEAVHRGALGHVGKDFLENARLRPGEGKGQGGGEFFLIAPRGSGQDRSLEIVFEAAGMAQRDLLREQLVKLQTPPLGGETLAVGLKVGARQRVVQALEGLRQARQAQRGCKGVGDDVREVHVEHRPVDALSQPRLRDVFARRVDGREGRG